MPRVSETYLEAKRAEILDAAMRCFVRRGFHVTTMQDICKEAGVSAGAVYRYFPSKEELINAAYQRTVTELRGTLTGGAAGAASPAEALLAVGRHTFGFFDSADFGSRAVLNVELWSEILRNPALNDAEREQFRALRALFVAMMERVPRAPAYRDLDLSALATLFFALFWGLIYYKALEPDDVDTTAVLELLTRLLQPAIASDTDTEAAT